MLCNLARFLGDLMKRIPLSLSVDTEQEKSWKVDRRERKRERENKVKA